MSEFLRVFNLKKIIMLICLIFINLGLFAYINIPKSNKALSEREIYTQEMYINTYQDNVNNVIERADNLQKFSIFNKGKTFTYSNIIRTANDFKRIVNVNVCADNSRAVEAFTDYYYTYYIAFFFLIVIIYDLFKYRENGMWQITYSTKDGREHTALTNIFIIVVGGLITVVIMAGSVFLYSLLLYGGINDLNNPIQNIKSFGKFTYPISKLQYVIMLIAVDSLVVVSLGLIVWTVFMMFRQRNYAVVFIAGFIGLECVLYNNIEINSIWNVLHFINVNNLLQLNEMLRTYINWGFGEYVFSVSSVVLFATFVITVILTCVACISGCSMHPYGKTTLWDRAVDVIIRMYQRILARVPQFIKELHKLVFSGHGLWFIAAVIFVVIYASSNGTMTYTDEQLLRDEMYLEHGGQDKEYIRAYTDEKIADAKSAMQKLTDLTALKDTSEAGEDWNERYFEANGEYQYARTKAAFCMEFSDKLKYIDDVKEQYGVNVWLISERGYSEIIGNGSAMRETMILIALLIAVMFMSSENIQLEYATGMEYILNSSVYGRDKRRIHKYISATTFFVLLSLVVFCIEYIYLYNAYGMPYLQAPALSLQSIYDKLGHGIYSLPFIKSMIVSTSIGGFIMFRSVIEIFLICIAMNVSLLIAYVSKGRMNRAFHVVSVVIMIAMVCYIRLKLI